MTEYALAPNSKFTAESPYRSPRVMLEQGLLRAYRVRSNGTMRHLNLYPLDGTPREAAEWVSDRVEMEGASVATVARELHVGTATVRRYLEGLALTEEIEAGEWDGLSFDAKGEPVWDTAWTESTMEADELDGELSPEARAYAAGTVVVDLVPVAGDACEPAGTPADEVEEALEASLARVTAGPRDIHLCTCPNLPEAHGRAVEGCRHAEAAQPRYSRSH